MGCLRSEILMSKFNLIPFDNHLLLTIKGNSIELSKKEFTELYLFMVNKWDELTCEYLGRERKSE